MGADSSYVHEQDGLRELASYLPDADPYHVWANVEFVGADGSINEVDALVLTPSGLYVLELKHWQGEIRGDGTQWVRRGPNSRLIPEDNPYILANRKAKRLASLIRYYARQQGRESQISDPDHYLPESARLLGGLGRAVREAERLVLDDAYHRVGHADAWGRTDLDHLSLAS